MTDKKDLVKVFEAMYAWDSDVIRRLMATFPTFLSGSSQKVNEGRVGDNTERNFA